jgi:hypothetical protein
VVEQYSATGEQMVGFPVINADIMPGHLGYGIRAQGMHRSLFGDRQMGHFPKHLATGSLVKPDRRINQPDGFEKIQDGFYVKVDGANGLLKRQGDGALSRQVIDLVRFNGLYDVQHLGQIAQIALHQFHFVQHFQEFQST